MLSALAVAAALSAKILNFQLAVSLLLIFSAGCSSAGRVLPPDATYEFESVTEQAIADVDSAQTTFDVDPETARYVWERAEFFYRHYLGLNEKIKYTADSKVLGGSDKHGYQWNVTGGTASQTGTFSVACEARANGASAKVAELNAKNLARFLNTGTLEVDLLPR